MNRSWQVRLARQAELDLVEVSKWTAHNFGALHAEYYAETVSMAIEALNDGPEILGSKARDEIGQGLTDIRKIGFPRKHQGPTLRNHLRLHSLRTQ
jgi:plasmid stabilization system protein ParE